jgi:hypothetical protein
MFNILEAAKEELVLWLVDMLRDTYPSEDEEQLRKKAKKSVFALAHLISFGLVKRVSHSVGSPDLTQTYQRVLGETPPPIVSLFDLSIRLDNQTSFPESQIKALRDQFEKGFLTSSILRRLVVQHFYLFPVDFRLRQRMCSELGIPFRRTEIADPRRKLLPGH